MRLGKANGFAVPLDVGYETTILQISIVIMFAIFACENFSFIEFFYIFANSKNRY